MQSQKDVNKFFVSFPYFVDKWQTFSVANISQDTAVWFIRDGPKFIAEKVVPEKSNELKEHRSFSIKCGALDVTFTPNEQGFDISFVKKLRRVVFSQVYCFSNISIDRFN